jgi:hypothetical protein
MTTEVDNCNIALGKLGIQKVIRSLSQDSVEAKACNVTYSNTRDSLLRMAPWNCAMKTANLDYITSVPGTPENTSAATNLWQPGQPRPPWAYEYQYPVDCLKACWIIPAAQTGYSGGVPITTAVTGGASSTWLEASIRFKIGIDRFWSVKTALVINAGTGYAVGEIITLETVPSTLPPNGAPGKIRVLTIDGTGGVLTAQVVNQIIGANPEVTGSYFNFTLISNRQGSTTGSGTGATFNFDAPVQGDQRVILTNQQNTTMVYVSQVTDPNIWDPTFQDAFTNALAGDLCMTLKGDKVLAQTFYAQTNEMLKEARVADANEGLTVNDIVPDWISGRGIYWNSNLTPFPSLDWGGQYGTGF